MKEEIMLPCPFCGGIPEIKQDSRNGFKLKCTSCLIGIKQKTIRNSLEWLREKMIEGWNKREASSPNIKSEQEIENDAIQYANDWCLPKTDEWFNRIDGFKAAGKLYSSSPNIKVEESQKIKSLEAQVEELKKKTKAQTEMICGQVMEIDSLHELNRKIRENLSAPKINVEEAAEVINQSLKLIKQWHNMQCFLTRQPENEIEKVWNIYYDNAPEMKIIREWQSKHNDKNI